MPLWDIDRKMRRDSAPPWASQQKDMAEETTVEAQQGKFCQRLGRRGKFLIVRNHMKTKDEFNFSAQSSMSSIGRHVLFVLVRRF